MLQGVLATCMSEGFDHARTTIRDMQALSGMGVRKTSSTIPSWLYWWISDGHWGWLTNLDMMDAHLHFMDDSATASIITYDWTATFGEYGELRCGPTTASSMGHRAERTHQHGQRTARTRVGRVVNRARQKS